MQKSRFFPILTFKVVHKENSLAAEFKTDFKKKSTVSKIF